MAETADDDGEELPPNERAFQAVEELRDASEGTEIVVTVDDDCDPELAEEVEIPGTVVGRERCRDGEFILKLDTDRGRRCIRAKPEPGFVEGLGPAPTWGIELLVPAGDDYPEYKYRSADGEWTRDVSVVSSE